MAPYVTAILIFLWGLAMFFGGYWVGVRQTYREARQLYEKMWAAKTASSSRPPDTSIRAGGPERRQTIS